MDAYIGKMLDGRYEILEVIGTGGMAIVYKAMDHRLNRQVAVKVLKNDLAQNADFRRRFHDEAQAVAMLSHPNIVSVYDVSHDGDAEYIVMELIDGITLKQYMERRGQLNWREALHFITQIMKGLGHAHSRGIIHRDIKPHNIMILRDGSVKVADFGIACLVASAENTLTQEALGSVHYISPEQAKGGHTDARTDIYSAGVVLYEMLTDRLPFEGDSAVSIAIQHISSVPLSPREINPDSPEALELITMKAMQDDGTMLCDAVLTREDYEDKKRTMSEEIASANYQQEPIDLKGRLYSGFKTYKTLPSFKEIRNYTDTADTGADFLCSIDYGVTLQNEAYVLDVLYTKAPMEDTEPATARMLYEDGVDIADIESNNGGRGFARSVERILRDKYDSNRTRVSWFHQSKNKIARILSNATWVMDHVYFPENWRDRWPEYAHAMMTYQKEGKNAHDDAPDATTGIAEKIGRPPSGISVLK